MKKVISLLMAAFFALGVCRFASFAVSPAEIYVTVATKGGELALAFQRTSVTDKDGDSALTVNDALICAHEEYCSDGAAGYGTATGDYGLYITKLWGEKNGTGFGYYLNDASLWSLTDSVQAGDHLYAYVYTDTEAFSDAYSFFDETEIATSAYKPFELTLKKLVYDTATWSNVCLPVVGAVIEIDGEATDFVTDAEGKVTIILPETGSHVISASSESEVLVPPVCLTETSKGSFLDAVSYYFGVVVKFFTNIFDSLFELLGIEL